MRIIVKHCLLALNKFIPCGWSTPTNLKAVLIQKMSDFVRSYYRLTRDICYTFKSLDCTDNASCRVCFSVNMRYTDVFVYLVAVVIAFFVCWAPFNAQRLMFFYVTLYSEWTPTLRQVNQQLFYIAGKFTV